MGKEVKRKAMWSNGMRKSCLYCRYHNTANEGCYIRGHRPIGSHDFCTDYETKRIPPVTRRGEGGANLHGIGAN